MSIKDNWKNAMEVRKEKKEKSSKALLIDDEKKISYSHIIIKLITWDILRIARNPSAGLIHIFMEPHYTPTRGYYTYVFIAVNDDKKKKYEFWGRKYQYGDNLYSAIEKSLKNNGIPVEHTTREVDGLIICIDD